RILYRCLKDQEARLLLFPCVSEHSLTIPSQGEDFAPQEGSHAEVPLSFGMRMTGRTEKRIATTQK
ncbi:MAG TPA: hypothetical protein VFV38_12740, partial [Ktedonobacteraceae bacterium]|nr:hypothetical protein [Ktedonobacteraceae bacterium]